MGLTKEASSYWFGCSSCSKVHSRKIVAVASNVLISFNDDVDSIIVVVAATIIIVHALLTITLARKLHETTLNLTGNANSAIVSLSEILT